MNVIYSSVRLRSLLNKIKNIIDIFSDFIVINVLKVRNLFKYGFLYERDLNIVTASDKFFFDSLIQLIESIYKFEIESKIYVYDIGLSDDQKEKLNILFPNIIYKQFDFSKYPKFFSIRDEYNKLGAYAWKSAIISEFINLSNQNFVWMDTGNILTGQLRNLKILLTSYGFYSPLSNGTIKTWTHKNTLKYLSVNNSISSKRNLTGGIIGINPKLDWPKELIDNWYKHSSVEECISPEGSSRENHRQDQSLLSILFYQDVNKYILKSKQLFNIKVNQNPGVRIYLSEGYDNKKIAEYRRKWYSINDEISTNTISAGKVIWILSYEHINKIPKKYLKNSTVFLSIIKEPNESEIFKKKIKNYDRFINFYLVSEQLVNNFKILINNEKFISIPTIDKSYEEHSNLIKEKLNNL